MVKLRLHPLFLLLGLTMFFLGSGYLFIAYLITIVAHEMGHSAAAAHFGFTLDEVSLMPYGAVLNGENGGMEPRTEILVSLAGPAVNVVLALVFTALWWLVPSTYFFTEAFVTSNVTTALLNLLPIYPLDGGRVTLAVLSTKMQRGRAMRAVRICGLIIGGVFAVLSLVSLFFKFNITLSVMTIFIITGTLNVAKSASYLRIIALSQRSKALKTGITAREVCIHKSATLFAVSRLLTGPYYYSLTVMDDTLHPIKTLSERDLDTAFAKHDLYDTLESIYRL